MSMKVRFKGVGDLEQRVSQGANSLQEGTEYHVLEIFAQADGANKFRIEFSKRELPSLFDSRLFEISSGEIPNGWCVSRSRSGSLILGPEEWLRPGFWEAYVDHERWALDLYLVGRSKSLT